MIYDIERCFVEMNNHNDVHILCTECPYQLVFFSSENGLLGLCKLGKNIIKALVKNQMMTLTFSYMPGNGKTNLKYIILNGKTPLPV